MAVIINMAMLLGCSGPIQTTHFAWGPETTWALIDFQVMDGCREPLGKATIVIKQVERLGDPRGVHVATARTNDQGQVRVKVVSRRHYSAETLHAEAGSRTVIFWVDGRTVASIILPHCQDPTGGIVGA